MDAPAHSIYEWSPIVGHERDGDADEDGATTSLAEAIKSRDESLIRMIEDAGSLAHLNEGGRFQPAITAASKTGNAIYVQKLLEHCPSPEPSLMKKAVSHAIRNNHEQISRTLLAAGAEVNEKYDSYDKTNVLLAAMVCRNSYMVREILNADIKPSSYTQIRVFQEAIEWGDKSIIEDLQSTFPGTQLNGNELPKALKQCNMEWFEFLLSSRMVQVLLLRVASWLPLNEAMSRCSTISSNEAPIPQTTTYFDIVRRAVRRCSRCSWNNTPPETVIAQCLTSGHLH